MLRVQNKLLIVLLAVCFSSGLVWASHHGQGAFFGAYNNSALHGDLSRVESELSKTITNAEEEDYYKRFRARFIERTDGLDLDAIEDDLLRSSAALYQEYWRDALVNPAEIARYETALSNNLVSILRKDGWANANADNVFDQLKAAIEAKGFFLLLGRTAPLLEFMAWRETETIAYDVQLTDGSQSVTVNFLNGFISRGWISFATMGKDATGGWAKRDGLFAAGTYDRKSEKFLISYLKHEGRHFADYQIFPKLVSADLEYRAKLTELAFADDELRHLLRSFTALAKKDSMAPHPLANWYVISSMSAALLDKTWPDESQDWDSFSNDTIRKTARNLLEANTLTLKAKGADTVTGVLRP